jgi:glutaconyl-CoA decarboxylase
MGGRSVRKYQININDKKYSVEIDDLDASPVAVRVNGKAFEVTVTDQSSEVQTVLSLEDEAAMDEPYVPVVASTFVDATTELASEPAEATSTAPAPSEGLESVVAPMPGKIMDIVVKVGDQVKQGDTLCNLEAMKMKSPIRSTGDGVIAQVLINEGQNVNYGDALFILG